MIPTARGLTVFWGKKHLELFKKLLWSVEADLNDLGTNFIWDIYCDESEHHEVMEALEKKGAPRYIINLMSTMKLNGRVDKHHEALCLTIKKCIENNEKTVLLPPDTMFSRGTIKNIIEMSERYGKCVAIAHPRVTSDFEVPSNDAATMVTATMGKYMHRSWKDAEVGHPRNNSFIGGVEWKKIAPKLFSIKHRLPTVYCAHFTKEDLVYFQRAISFGVYDHSWPADVLIQRDRYRLVGGSDAGFCVEITEDTKNIPPVDPRGQDDKFWKDIISSHVNACFQVIFRGA